jgi:hypothetical protein
VALTLDQGAKMVTDTSFNNRVRCAMMRAATTVAGEAQGVQSSTRWAKRLQLAARVIGSPDSQLTTFVAMVASDPGLSLTWYAPVNISSSTNANPSVVTTAAAHGYSSGDVVEILNHAVNTNANGTWVITVTSTTAFSIPQPANGVGGATGTVQKMETDVNLNFTISNQWNAMAGVANGE